MGKVAILVDGGFYKKRAKVLFGDKSPEERADELVSYCMRHLKDDTGNHDVSLYRIFYYDCPPSDKVVYNPITEKTVDLKEHPLYDWNNKFLKELASKRKVALRMGELLEGSMGYILKAEVLKKLCRKEITVDDLKESDLQMDIKQKGVDMRIGLDISSIAFKKQADQIILIAGDSDFVPAAKHARREGIDFILDPMWQPIKESLNEHIDGLRTVTPKPGSDKKDPLNTKKSKYA